MNIDKFASPVPILESDEKQQTLHSTYTELKKKSFAGAGLKCLFPGIHPVVTWYSAQIIFSLKNQPLVHIQIYTTNISQLLFGRSEVSSCGVCCPMHPTTHHGELFDNFLEPPLVHTLPDRKCLTSWDFDMVSDTVWFSHFWKQKCNPQTFTINLTVIVTLTYKH